MYVKLMGAAKYILQNINYSKKIQNLSLKKEIALKKKDKSLKCT